MQLKDLARFFLKKILMTSGFKLKFQQWRFGGDGILKIQRRVDFHASDKELDNCNYEVATGGSNYVVTDTKGSWSVVVVLEPKVQ